MIRDGNNIENVCDFSYLISHLVTANKVSSQIYNFTKVKMG